MTGFLKQFGWKVLCWGLVAAGVSLGTRAGATTVTVQVAGGRAWDLGLQAFAPSPDNPPRYYIPFSRFAEILQRLNTRSGWTWDARTGLLRIEALGRRFSISSTRPIMIINEEMFKVSSPMWVTEGEMWIPLSTFRRIIGSLDGLRLMGSENITVGGALATSASIVRSPAEAIRGSILPNGSDIRPSNTLTSAAMLNIPPPDSSGSWRIVFDPALVDLPPSIGKWAGAIRPSLAQIADRCASILRGEGSLEPLILTEHTETTSPELILEWLSHYEADIVVFLRLETSPLRESAGYSVLYMDESVDGPARSSDSGATDSTRVFSPRSLSYRPFQGGSRHLARRIHEGLAGISGFRDRLVLPMPLYLLKRCPSPSVMILFSFPEGSSELQRLADSGFRESVARALAGALLTYRRDRAATPGAPLRQSGILP